MVLVFDTQAVGCWSGGAEAWPVPDLLSDFPPSRVSRQIYQPLNHHTTGRPGAARPRNLRPRSPSPQRPRPATHYSFTRLTCYRARGAPTTTLPRGRTRAPIKASSPLALPLPLSPLLSLSLSRRRRRRRLPGQLLLDSPARRRRDLAEGGREGSSQSGSSGGGKRCRRGGTWPTRPRRPPPRTPRASPASARHPPPSPSRRSKPARFANPTRSSLLYPLRVGSDRSPGRRRSGADFFHVCWEASEVSAGFESGVVRRGGLGGFRHRIWFPTLRSPVFGQSCFLLYFSSIFFFFQLNQSLSSVFTCLSARSSYDPLPFVCRLDFGIFWSFMLSCFFY